MLEKTAREIGNPLARQLEAELGNALYKAIREVRGKKNLGVAGGYRRKVRAA